MSTVDMTGRTKSNVMLQQGSRAMSTPSGRPEPDGGVPQKKRYSQPPPVSRQASAPPVKAPPPPGTLTRFASVPARHFANGTGFTKDQHKKLPLHPAASSRQVLDSSEALPPPNAKRRSSVKTETDAFEDDTRFMRILRYLRLLPPTPNEHPLRRRMRILTWWALLLDFLVAIVSILTFGEITSCCGEVIFPGKFDWNKLMQVISYLYLIGIFIEIHPVVREIGPVPWNLVNPIFGFMISFAVFVDDSRAEAISIWILEMGSIVLEFIIYRCRLTLYREESTKLGEVNQNIKNVKGEKYSGSYKKTQLQRERRQLREKHIQERKNLKTHFIAVGVNITLVCVTLLLIIFVAKSGGMCVRDGERPSLFQQNQQDRCPECAGSKKDCEICNDDGSTVCYYPYY